MPNYAKEARIREILADEGVLDSEHETFLIEHREGLFSDDPTDIRRHVAERRETRPHRFTGKDERALCCRAFVDGNLGAQGEIVKRYGLAEANRIADQYGTRIGSTICGADPHPDADKDHANNPWANRSENVDPKTGRYSSSGPQLIRLLNPSYHVRCMFPPFSPTQGCKRGRNIALRIQIYAPCAAGRSLTSGEGIYVTFSR